MYPLIEIKTVPIEIQVKTKNASLEYTRGTAEMEISRNENGLDIKSRPIKLQLDTFEARDSLKPASMSSVWSRNAEKGEQQAYEATATYAQHGKLMLNAKLGQNVTAQIAAEKTNEKATLNGELEFLPSTGPDIQWEDGTMEIQYEMDKLNFDWKIENSEFKFTPGDIEISVAQQPSVTIRYIGGPLYVPPSADPNYQPVDVKA